MTTALRGRPTKEAAAELPPRILAAAQELFLSQGYERTSVTEVAAAAGVTKRTVYLRVGEKATLLAAVVDGLLSRARTRLDDPGPGTPLRSRLERFCVSLLDLALDPDVLRLYRLVVAEGPRFPELAALMQEQLARGAQVQLTVILADAPDPALAARLLSSLVLGEPTRSTLYGEAWDEARRRDWVAVAVRLFLGAGS